MIQAESLINSRPLTAVRTDLDDLEPLTPQQFLIGQCKSTLSVEEAADEDCTVHPARRWKLLQQLVRDVWNRWLREFVPTLNVQQTWLRKSRRVQTNDIVLCMDQGTPRGRWPLARVVAVYPGSDNTVRVVDVLVNGKVMRRPVSRLVPLEVDPVAKCE